MKFRYMAYTADNVIVKGIETAADIGMAGNMIAGHGLKLLSLKPLPGFIPRMGKISFSFSKIPQGTLVLFSRQLALLLESGTPLVNALELLRLQITNRRFRTVLADIAGDIRHGESLYKAISKHEDVFSRTYIQTLMVGEKSGRLEIILRQIADHMERDDNNRKNLKQAMTYPVIVVITAIIVIGVMFTVVLPSFTKLYGQLGAELPAMTRVLFTAGDWFSRYGLFAAGYLILVAMLIMIYVRTPKGRLSLDSLLLKIPLLGRVIQLNELARCCRSISMLYNSGFPMSETLEVVAGSTSNLVVEQELMKVHRDVLGGKGLALPMAESNIFLPLMAQMVSVGEMTASLDTTLTATAESFETEASAKMRFLTGLIQPGITIFMGLCIGFIAVALISAIYSLYGSVGI
jgi:type IV pilus assembly protein PilC